MEQLRNNRDVSDIEGAATPERPLDLREEAETVLPDEYASAYGEELSRTLDLDTWHSGDELARLYERLEAEVQEAVRQEDDTRVRIRQIVFPQLRN